MTAMAFGNQGNAISPDAPDDRLALIDFGTGIERHFTYGELRKATGAIARARSIWLGLKFDTPIHRTLPSVCNFAIAAQPSSTSSSGSGQCI